MHQLEADFLDPHFVELVENAENVDRLLLRNAGKIQQQIENRAAGEADGVTLDPKRRQRVAHRREHFCVGDLRFGSDRVEVELGELAEASFVGLVGAPDRRDLVAPKRARQIGVLRDDSRQGHGQIEAEAELLLFRIADPEERLLRFLPGASGEDVQILDRGRAEGNEAV